MQTVVVTGRGCTPVDDIESIIISISHYLQFNFGSVSGLIHSSRLNKPHTQKKKDILLLFDILKNNNNFCFNFSIYFPSAFRARAKIINIPPVCIQLIFGELFLFWQVAILILPEQVTTRNRREKQNKKICVFLKDVHKEVAAMLIERQLIGSKRRST